ncbi:MAG: DMT family transporter, partial [Patescibacteria group bacterium]
ETDITTGFEPVIGGSNPSGGTLQLASLAQCKHHFMHIIGITFALLALFSWGFGDFLIQKSTRKFGNWIALIYLASTKQLGQIVGDWKRNKYLILGVGFIDNLAWVAYFYSTTYIPIAIATSVSEAYIAFAAILGVVFNKETLRAHQVFGIVLAVVSVILLSAITAQ